ncbi:SulP family inorganic anion transporter [Flavicella marina]|uniref:SulP family inorganic anion transporter n=1 Tax=Flavicella marina TaxID=1475951 RepID=UPI0012648C25|nr:solute carrier family 26 protein [Flavicella marina]
MKKYFPILQWISKYNSSLLKSDAIAGITVGVVLIPQGIAYALIAGLPPIYGLYTALIPQLVYAVLGTSPRVAVGPVAMDSLLVAAGIASLVTFGTENVVSIAILLAFSVGVIQFLLGVLRLGFVVNFLSRPVISGFTSAAAIIIGVNQFRNLLGIPIPRSNQIHEITIHFVKNVLDTNLQTFAIGAGAILIIFVLKRINNKIPSPLVVVVIGILVLKFFSGTFDQVAIIKEIPSGLPSFSVPDISLEKIMQMLPIALTIAMIGFLETVSIGKSLEKNDDVIHVKPNQELIAIGLGNMLGSFFKSYPATASFSRSAVNQDSGAKTGFAAFFSVAIVAAVLLFLTPVFYYLPKAVLAAIIIVSVLKLIDYREAMRLWKVNKIDFWMLLVTFIGTLFFGIKEGIGVGVGLSLLMVIFRTSKPHIAVLGRIPNTGFFRNINRFDDVEVNPKVLILRFDSHLYFANTDYFREQLDRLTKEKGKSLELIVIDCECINGLDSTGAAMWNDRIDFYAAQGIKIYFANVKGPVRDAMTKSGIIEKIGIENCFMSNQGAMTYFETGNREVQKNLSSYIQQVNK